MALTLDDIRRKKLASDPVQPADAFQNYGPMDVTPYMPPVNPAIQPSAAPDTDQFSDTPRMAPSVALAPRQPGGMGAHNPMADLQEQRSDIGTKLQSALQPNPISTPRALIAALVSRRNPQLGGIISGDYQRQRAIQPLMAQYATLGDQIATERQYENQAIENYLKEAEAHKNIAEAGSYPAKQALESAQAEAANYKDDPNLGLIDLRTKQPISNAGFAPLTAEEAQVLGKQEGDRVPLKVKNTANEIVSRGLGTVSGTNDTYVVNKGTNQTTPLHIGSPRAIFAPENRIVPGAADPNNPGALTYMRAGTAMNTGALAPGAAAVGAAKTEAKSEVPTKIGDQIVAFNTMIQHAQLLRNAAQALNNGDVQTLAGLKNQFKNEFGYSGPITASAIADAYKGEVSNVINKGHITDQGNEKIAHTLDPSKQNYQTLDSVLGAYESLAKSKLNMLNQQANKVKGGGANAAPAATHIWTPQGLQPATNQ